MYFVMFEVNPPQWLIGLFINNKVYSYCEKFKKKKKGKNADKFPFTDLSQDY